MPAVDRNVMRIAVYELLCCPDIPYKVSLNEAIDIGKKFGTEESGAFINGILDSIRMALEKKEIEIKIDLPINEAKWRIQAPKGPAFGLTSEGWSLPFKVYR